MSDKVRIHDLAKQYGLSGKDLASKLRDFGFSKARSHMSALDQFELVQAQGVLEANGIAPANAQSSEASQPTGGLKVVRKRKKIAGSDPSAPDIVETIKVPDVAPSDTDDPLPATRRPLPRVPARSETSAPAEPHGAPAKEEAPVHSSSSPSSVEAEPAEAPSQAEAPIAEPSPDPVAEPAEPAAPVAPVAPAAQVAEATSGTAAIDTGPTAAEGPSATESATESAPESARPRTAPRTEPSAGAPAPVTPAQAQPATDAPRPIAAAGGASAPVAPTTSPATPALAGVGGENLGAAAKATGAATGAAGEPAAPASPAAASTTEGGAGDKKTPARRGNVVGFVDPATFQTSLPKKRASSRRLQSRDDATVNVRPTFGRGPGRPGGVSQAHTGPRGKLTAAQLREREQGRFLRRNRTSMTGHTQGRRGGGRRHENTTDSPFSGSSVAIDEPITVAKLADSLSLKASLVVKKCFQSGLGMFTVNQNIDSETATLLAAEFEVELDIREDISAEQAHLEEVRLKRNELEEGELVDRSPTVAFLGHVDHGKTTLIDKIRQTRVAEGEAGGITQHVGAYQVTTAKGHLITVIDTPGHEAFTSMRARGAKAVDIVVLVVAGDDGVKPSTVEAINHAKAASTPIVVAINKSDRPQFNANTVVQQLMGHELVPEQYGGKTAMFNTSGMNGEGIEELLEHIFLMGELELALKAHPTGPASGVVLEAEIQQGRGIVAHLLVQDGTLNKGDIILAGEGYGKVRQILNDRVEPIASAGPSVPVAVTGLDALPGVGDPFFVVEALSTAKDIASERERSNRAKLLAEARDPRKQLQALLNRDADANHSTVNIIVRADVQGTAEVIKSEISKLQHEEVEMKVIHSGVGPITESDVDLATPSSALLLAFHVGVHGKARQMADRAGLEVRRYEVIYELLDDLRSIMEGALAPDYEEVIIGHTEIRAIFKSSRIGLIAGCMVLDGKIKRSSMCRLMRDGTVVYTGKIGSLRREKEEAKEVRADFECGIVLKDYRDIRQGDIIESYEMKEIKRTL